MSTFVLRLFDYLPRWLTNWVLQKRGESRVLKRLTDPLASSLRNQEAKIGSGVGKGLFINVGTSAAAYVLGTFKPELQQFLNSSVKEGDVFYDVGANVGFFSLLAARLVGPKGKVVCFEPLPENLLNLRGNVERNKFYNAQILPVALGATNQEQIFQVSERPTWGKLKDVGLEAPDRYLTDIKVRVRRLDDIISEGTLQPPNFIKIDVEGAEIEVVEGARDTLERYGPALIIELHGTGHRITQLFAELGYCAVPLHDSFKDIAQAHWNATILAFPNQHLMANTWAQRFLHD